MKKAPFFAGIVVGIVLALVVGFFCALPYIAKHAFRCVYVHAPVESHLGYFGYGRDNALPEGSTEHYFFREGFGDVDEFWSFRLPPDRIEDFIGEYVLKHRIPKAGSDLPSTVINPALPQFAESFEEWQPEYWFDDIADLDEMYLKLDEWEAGEFAAYSKKNGRVYLMNWNR